MRNPIFDDIGVIAFLPDRWEDTWTTRHHVLTRLGRYYHTTWIEEPRYWRHFRLAAVAGTKQELEWRSYPGLHVHKPNVWTLKLFRPRWLSQFLYRRHIQSAVRRLRSLGVKKIVLYLWRPRFAPVLKDLDSDLTVYHVDDEYTFTETEQPTPPDEQQLLGAVDLVILHSPALMEKKGGYNESTIYVPNGVDYEAYTAAKPEPEDIKAIPGPRIGYSGVIKMQLNFQVMIAIAKARPDVSLVLVGPVGHLGHKAAEFEALVALKNVYQLGGKPTSVLPAYVQHFDLCLMPYEVNGYTKFIYPLKLNEYLACGKPVVSSSLPAVREMGSVVEMADDTQDWLRLVDKQLKSLGESDLEQARRSVARAHDWNELVRRIGTQIARRLGPEVEAQLISADSDQYSSTYDAVTTSV